MKLTRELLDIKEDGEVVITQYFCSDIIKIFFDVINTIDVDQLPEEIQNEIYYIINSFEDYDEENEEEENEINEIAILKKKISAQDKLAHHKYYLQHKNQIKQTLKKYRQSSKYKQWKLKQKKMAKQGKTATGKIITHYI